MYVMLYVVSFSYMGVVLAKDIVENKTLVRDALSNFPPLSKPKVAKRIITSDVRMSNNNNRSKKDGKADDFDKSKIRK